MLCLGYIQSWQYILGGMMVAHQCNLVNKNTLRGYLSFDIGYKSHTVMDYTGHVIQEHPLEQVDKSWMDLLNI